MKSITKILAIFFAVCLFAAVFPACSSSGSGDEGETPTYYLVVSGAQFNSGSPSGSQNAQAVTKPTVRALTEPTFSAGWTVQWEVDWTTVTEFEVTDIIIEIPNMDGYFDYMLTDEDLANGWAGIEMEVVEDTPSTTQWCNRDYRGNGTCYGEVPSSITGDTQEQDIDFSAAQFLDASGSYSWGPYLRNGYFIEVGDSDDGSNDGDDEDGGGDYCYTANVGCEVTACTNCDATSAWYVVNGHTVNCGSTFTNSCATAAASYCSF